MNTKWEHDKTGMSLGYEVDCLAEAEPLEQDYYMNPPSAKSL